MLIACEKELNVAWTISTYGIRFVVLIARMVAAIPITETDPAKFVFAHPTRARHVIASTIFLNWRLTTRALLGIFV